MADVSDDQGSSPEHPHRPERPVLTGLIALVLVGLTVGGLAGLGVLAATKVTGMGGGNADSTSTARESMIIPDREKTTVSPGPLISAGPNDENPSESKSTQGTTISLQAAQTSVSPGQRIDLTGAYPGGAGATLQVQRFTDGDWSDFDVTINVGAGNYSTWLVTSVTGQARFRVYDSAADLASNEVVVRIG